jgi:hypothetical protein
MDETGFQIGVLARAWVVINSSSGMMPYRTHPGRQEWISALECICADGSTVPPLLIFKGKGVNNNLFFDHLTTGSSANSEFSYIRYFYYYSTILARISRLLLETMP